MVDATLYLFILEALICFSVGLNIVLVWLLVRQKKAKKSSLQAETITPKKEPLPVVNAYLKDIAEKCEAKLPEADRGKVKLLVYKEEPEHPALLQIGDLKISLRRKGINQSLFQVSSFLTALELANDYGSTSRYIPVPEEACFILSQRHIINVYLEALGLEQIPKVGNFCCVDTETGWNTGWKRFDNSVQKAFDKLSNKAGYFNSSGFVPNRSSYNCPINLFLLLKGWESLFIEV